MTNPRYALKFISGKYQGGEFPLKMDREIIIGRSSDLDMVLVEDMVSRNHAKITTHGGQVTIQDMGSTNGTFVNGEKIKKVTLKEGDRVLVGTSIIKLIVPVEGALHKPMMQPPSLGLSPKRTMTGAARSMVGTIDEIPLPDLIQLLSTSKKSGVLEIQSKDGVGRIYLRQGQIYYATINDSYDLSPHKSLFRMLVWETGHFSLQPPDDKEFLDELNEPTEGLLMEAMRQLDEIRHRESELPGPHAVLQLASNITSPLRDLSPELLDVLQQVHNNGKVGKILDNSPATDLATYDALAKLLSAGIIEKKRSVSEVTG